MSGYVDSGFANSRDDMTLDEIKQIFFQRFEEIDYTQAKSGVLPSIRDPTSLDMWSKEFF